MDIVFNVTKISYELKNISTFTTVSRYSNYWPIPFFVLAALCNCSLVENIVRSEFSKLLSHLLTVKEFSGSNLQKKFFLLPELGDFHKLACQANYIFIETNVSPHVILTLERPWR